jgi:hypothetical protein
MKNHRERPYLQGWPILLRLPMGAHRNRKYIQKHADFLF